MTGNTLGLGHTVNFGYPWDFIAIFRWTKPRMVEGGFKRCSLFVAYFNNKR